MKLLVLSSCQCNKQNLTYQNTLSTSFVDISKGRQNKTHFLSAVLFSFIEWYTVVHISLQRKVEGFAAVLIYGTVGPYSHT
jgi:hypothetical protein